jgi:hypothetical protein
VDRKILQHGNGVPLGHAREASLALEALSKSLINKGFVLSGFCSTCKKSLFQAHLAS